MTIKALKKRLVSSLGPSVAYWVIRALGWTMRFEEVRPEIPGRLREAGTTGIGAFWHGRLLMMPLAYRGKKLAFLVSPHRDGQVVGRALERFGFLPIKGSTTRGGFSGFKGMLRAQREGYDVAVVPDGPRGPRCRAQIGVIELARLTGRPIVPFAFSASRRRVFNTWDRFLLPLPFSRGVFVWGEPVAVDRESDREGMEEKRQLLERRLNELTEEADRHFNRS
jgi:lysophospholipid acyltransferase (LPLAT)-like uncharacterized protein